MFLKYNKIMNIKSLFSVKCLFNLLFPCSYCLAIIRRTSFVVEGALCSFGSFFKNKISSSLKRNHWLVDNGKWKGDVPDGPGRDISIYFFREICLFRTCESPLLYVFQLMPQNREQISQVFLFNK